MLRLNFCMWAPRTSPNKHNSGCVWSTVSAQHWRCEFYVCSLTRKLIDLSSLGIGRRWELGQKHWGWYAYNHAIAGNRIQDGTGTSLVMLCDSFRLNELDNKCVLFNKKLQWKDCWFFYMHSNNVKNIIYYFVLPSRHLRWWEPSDGANLFSFIRISTCLSVKHRQRTYKLGTL